MNRIMHQVAGEPKCAICFFLGFSSIFSLILEFNESKNILMKSLNAKSNGIVLSH